MNQNADKVNMSLKTIFNFATKEIKKQLTGDMSVIYRLSRRKMVIDVLFLKQILSFFYFTVGLHLYYTLGYWKRRYKPSYFIKALCVTQIKLTNDQCLRNFYFDSVSNILKNCSF